MSNYTKTTDFEAKDSLPTGDSGKIIRGAEFETEFDAISTAIATKADTAGPTFTGTLTFETISDGTIGVTAFVDEDDMSSDSATLVPTQQSVKAYVDSQVTAQDLDFQADSGGALSIDLDSETMTFTGGTGIDTSGSGNAVTFAIDSTVATLTGSQTLTNKTLTSPVLNTGVSGTAVLDEDDMSSNSATQLATQQSIKAYVDSQVGANNELSEILANGNTTGGTNIVFGDSASVSDDRLVFGDGSDLQIYHSGVHSYIDDAGTGNLTLRGNASVRVEKYEGEILADFAADGAVSLYHDNSVKIATTSTGVSVTGNVAVSGTVDGRDVATDGSKLDGIEASADVTDTANVTAAGALMDSELTSEASVKALNQGVATTDSPTFAGVTVNGTVEFDGLSGTGAVNVTDILDQDDMSSNSATALATQQSIKAYVDSQVATADTLAEVLANGNTTGGTDIAVGTGDDITFADSSKAIFGAGNDFEIYSDGTNGVLKNTNSNYILLDSDNLAIRSQAGSNRVIVNSSGINVTGTVTADGLTVDTGSTFALSATLGHTGGSQLLLLNDDGGSRNQIDSQKNSASAALDLATGGTKRQRIDSNGDISFYEDTGTTAKLFWDASAEKLGIGTTTATAALTVNHALPSGNAIAEFRSTGNTTSSVVIRADGTGDSNIQFNLNGVTPFAIGVDNSDGDKFKISDSYQLGTNDRFVIDGSSGNVGIGTTSPDSALVVQGGQGTYAQIKDGTVTTLLQARGQDSIGVTGTLSNHGFGFFTNSTERMRIDASGNVGIGTSSPNAGLEVLKSGGGKIRISETASRYVEILGYAEGTANGSTMAFQTIEAGTSTSTERMRIDSSGNVGIGESSPEANLHVKNGSAGTFTASNAQVLIENNTTVRLSMVSPATNACSIEFGDVNDQNVGVITYDHASDFMKFGVNASEAMRIDSGGQVGIGTSSPSYKLDVFGSSVVSMVRTNDTTSPTLGLFVNSGSNGVGTISVDNGGHMTFDTGSTGAGQVERMRIDSSGNVGIGTSSPATKVEISGTGFQTLSVTSTNSSPVLKLNSAASSTAFLQWNNAGSSPLSFYDLTASAERMRISSAGTVLVGKTAEGTATDGIELNRNDVVVVTRNGDAPLLLNRRTSDGDLAVFRKDNTTVGSIGAYSGDVYIAEGDTGLRFNADNDLILPFNGSSGSLATRDAAIDLGTTGGRFKDLYLSGSVKVPAASKGIEYSSTAFITPENNVSGAEVSTPGVFVVKTGSTPAEAMRVDGSGNLLVGKTSASFTTAGLELRNGGPAIFGRSQAEPLILNRLTTDGGIVNFNKDGTTVGTIGSVSSGVAGISFVNPTYGGIRTADYRINPVNGSGVNFDNSIDLGAGGTRWKDLYLAGGVYLGGTGVSQQAG